MIATSFIGLELLHFVRAAFDAFHLVLLVSVLLAVVGSTLFSLLLLSPIIVSTIIAVQWLGRRHDRIRIINAKLTIELGLLELRHFPRLVNKFGWHILQFRKPESYVVAMLVVIFALLHNVEAVQPSTCHTGGRAPAL